MVKDTSNKISEAFLDIIQVGNFLLDKEEVLKELTKNRKTEDLQRYKGLGEMDANQLWETTMDPLKRSLIQVKITDVALAEKRVSILMGDKVEPRKEWIEENVYFTLEDSYEMLR